MKMLKRSPATTLYSIFVSTSLLISLATPIKATSDEDSYIYFSGSGETSSGDTDVFSDLADGDDVTYWISGWDYSSLTGLDSSTAKFDSDSNDYVAEFYYESSSDSSNVFGTLIQAIGDQVEVEFTYDDDTTSTYLTDYFDSTVASIFSDSIELQIYLTGSSKESIDSFRIIIVYSTDANLTATTYSVSNDTVTVDLSDYADSVDDFDSLVSSYEEDIDEQLDSIESDASSSSDYGVIQILKGISSETSYTDEVVEFMLLDLDDQTEAIDSVLEEINEDVEIGLTMTESFDSTVSLVVPQDVFDLSSSTLYEFGDLSGTDDQTVLTITFLFGNLDPDSVDNTTLLDTLFSDAQEYGTSDSETTFTPTALETEDIESLVDLMNLSVDEEDGGTDSQGYYFQDVDDGTYRLDSDGSVTDPSIADANYILDSDSTTVVDANSGWYDTWMGYINIADSDAEWAYSSVFGFFYMDIASEESPWFYPVDQNIGTWINSSDFRSTTDGFWAYAADNGDDTSGLTGWLWFSVEASEADHANWFVYELDTDTFHSFTDL